MCIQWSVKCSSAKCGACVQCKKNPRCADSCYTNRKPWWPDDYPNHNSLYATSGYKCTSVPECLGCPPCTGKPNILFILADDVGIGDIDSQITSPLKNIDMLKKKGMSFSDAHTSPLCAPSRYIILSGRLQFRGRWRPGAAPTNLHMQNIKDHNIFAAFVSAEQLPYLHRICSPCLLGTWSFRSTGSQFIPGQISLAAALENAGYHTSMFGKWFVTLQFLSALNRKFRRISTKLAPKR